MIIAMWAVSLGWFAYYAGKTWGIGLGGCGLMFGTGNYVGPEGFYLESVDSAPRFDAILPGITRFPTAVRFDLPLWIPLIVLGFVTVVLFRRDRRIPPDHCQQCSYDLTGNEGGICPECGTAISEGADARA
jgi:hypothetical protein